MPSFQPMPKFCGITPPTLATPYFDPRNLQQKFRDPRHPLQSLTRATYESTIPTPTTLFSRLKLIVQVKCFFLDIFRYLESGVFRGFFQRHGENMFTTSLPDVKYKDIVFIAIYNQWDISAVLSHRMSEKDWHIFQSAS